MRSATRRVMLPAPASSRCGSTKPRAAPGSCSKPCNWADGRDWIATISAEASRVYYWGALTGKRRGLRFDPELLYAGAMFHDMGLTPKHASAHERFEVDSANGARDFLRSHGIAEHEIETVWTAIALHTTPGIPQHMHPVIALVTAGVEMDVLGIAFSEFTEAEREAVVHAHPRSGRFKEEIIQAFYDGVHHKPGTTFGNVK